MVVVQSIRPQEFWISRWHILFELLAVKAWEIHSLRSETCKPPWPSINLEVQTFIILPQVVGLLWWSLIEESHIVCVHWTMTLLLALFDPHVAFQSHPMVMCMASACISLWYVKIHQRVLVGTSSLVSPVKGRKADLEDTLFCRKSQRSTDFVNTCCIGVLKTRNFLLYLIGRFWEVPFNSMDAYLVMLFYHKITKSLVSTISHLRHWSDLRNSFSRQVNDTIFTIDSGGGFDKSHHDRWEALTAQTPLNTATRLGLAWYLGTFPQVPKYFLFKLPSSSLSSDASCLRSLVDLPQFFLDDLHFLLDHHALTRQVPMYLLKGIYVPIS